MKRLLCLVICLALILTTLSISVFAASVSKKIPVVFVPGTLGSFDAAKCDTMTNWYKKPPTKDSPTNIPGLFTAAYWTIPTGRDSKTIQSSFKLSLDGNSKLYYVNILQNVYDKLFGTLTSLGYIKDTDLFLFGYDTAEISINDNAAKLNSYIAYVKKKTGANKVNLIAHSQGNLVVRQYIQNNAGYNSVNKFIMLSPPNTGVTKSLGAFFMGDTKAPRTGFMEVDLEFLKYMTYYDTAQNGKPSMSQDSIIKWVQKKALALNDMIPTTNGTRNGKSVQIYQNSFLDNLNSQSGIKNLLKVGSGNIIACYGTNIKTIDGYTFTDTSYKNGTPSFANDGDDTVTIGSLKYLNQYGIKVVARKSVSHGGICGDDQVLKEIKTALQAQ